MRRIAVLLMAAAFGFGCVSTDSIESWIGHPTDELVFALGPPAQEIVLDDGRRVLTYQPRRLIEGTSFYCVAIFRSDVTGTVSSAEIFDENIGGCNRLLGSIAPSQD